MAFALYRAVENKNVMVCDYHRLRRTLRDFELEDYNNLKVLLSKAHISNEDED